MLKIFTIDTFFHISEDNFNNNNYIKNTGLRLCIKSLSLNAKNCLKKSQVCALPTACVCVFIKCTVDGAATIII